MKLILDITPQLLEGFRTIIREELEFKAEEIKKSPKSLSRKEVSEILGCSLPTLDMHIRSGRIKSRKVGRKIFIPESSINEFLSNGN